MMQRGSDRSSSEMLKDLLLRYFGDEVEIVTPVPEEDEGDSEAEEGQKKKRGLDLGKFIHPEETSYYLGQSLHPENVNDNSSGEEKESDFFQNEDTLEDKKSEKFKSEKSRKGTEQALSSSEVPSDSKKDANNDSKQENSLESDVNNSGDEKEILEDEKPISSSEAEEEKAQTPQNEEEVETSSIKNTKDEKVQNLKNEEEKDTSKSRKNTIDEKQQTPQNKEEKAISSRKNTKDENNNLVDETLKSKPTQEYPLSPQQEVEPEDPLSEEAKPQQTKEPQKKSNIKGNKETQKKKLSKKEMKSQEKIKKISQSSNSGKKRPTQPPFSSDEKNSPASDSIKPSSSKKNFNLLGRKNHNEKVAEQAASVRQICPRQLRNSNRDLMNTQRLKKTNLLEEEELARTYHPEINEISKELASRKRKQEEEQGSIWTSLHNLDKQLREKRDQKYLDKQIQDEEESLQYCTFKPAISETGRKVEISIYERGKQWKQAVDERIKKQKELKTQEEEKSCAFHPEISIHQDQVLEQSINTKGVAKFLERQRQAVEARKEKELFLQRGSGSSWSRKTTVPNEFVLLTAVEKGRRAWKNEQDFSPKKIIEEKSRKIKDVLFEDQPDFEKARRDLHQTIQKLSI